MSRELPDRSFFQNCAFICVDIQEGERGEPMTEDKMPEDWRRMGFTAEDVKAASDYGWDVCLPNAVRVVEACRRVKLPMVFIHWGCQFRDGMDLDPVIRRMMLKRAHGNTQKVGMHVSEPGARPAKCFNVQPDEYVLAKTAQDAFISSNLGFVLANLGTRNLVLIGGHTEACLGKTATSAKQRGFCTLIVEDATNNARESTRIAGIENTQCDYIVTTKQFIELVDTLT